MISGLLMTAALIFMYRRALGFPSREVFVHLLKVVPLAVLAGLVAWVVARFFPFMPTPGFIVNGVIGGAIAGGVGLAVYLLGAIALRMPEVAGVMRRLRR